MLLLSGRDDMRTPVENARQIAARYPRATVIEFPGVGHSVLYNDFGTCSGLVIARFLSVAVRRGCSWRTFAVDRYRPAT